ncbi:MAG: YihY family inner membrane protein, partial [Zetaproteobacteria bacterium]
MTRTTGSTSTDLRAREGAAGALRFALAFVARVFRRFFHDRCPQRAAALAYTSLLATVPLAALGFSIFSRFQAFAEVARKVRAAVLAHLLPTSQQAIEQYLASMAERAPALSVFGILGLVIVATALLHTTEEAFNDIWRVQRKRPWLMKLAAFWTMMTLAPLLFGASITITTWFATLPIAKELEAGTRFLREAPFLLPWLMSSFGFFAAYLLLPNQRVPKLAALVAGMIAGALFELAKTGFAYYVTNLAHFERLYGALTALPVFLVWLYLVWLITLWGAELTYCIEHPRSAHEHLRRAGERRFYALLALIELGRLHREGRAADVQALGARLRLPRIAVEEVMADLVRAELAVRVEAEGEKIRWAPGCDLHQV